MLTNVFWSFKLFYKQFLFGYLGHIEWYCGCSLFLIYLLENLVNLYVHVKVDTLLFDLFTILLLLVKYKGKIVYYYFLFHYYKLSRFVFIYSVGQKYSVKGFLCYLLLFLLKNIFFHITVIHSNFIAKYNSLLNFFCSSVMSILVPDSAFEKDHCYVLVVSP